MALIDTDKNGLGAGSHRQPGSAEVLLGRSLHGQHPTAFIETPLQDPRGSAHTKPQKNDFAVNDFAYTAFSYVLSVPQ